MNLFPGDERYQELRIATENEGVIRRVLSALVLLVFACIGLGVGILAGTWFFWAISEGRIEGFFDGQSSGEKNIGELLCLLLGGGLCAYLAASLWKSIVLRFGILSQSSVQRIWRYGIW